jgi:acyl-CoA synthetase (AMP-forming)/AMP-acid ligase II
MSRSATPASGYTLTDVIVRNARTRGDEVAFVHTSAVTHREHLRRVEQLAAGLHKAGITRGDRVAILSKNRIEYAELLGAAARLGAILSAINWRLSAVEVSAVLHGDEPRLVFAEDEFWPLLDPVLEQAGLDLEPIGIDSRRDGFRCIADLYLTDTASDVTPVHADDPVMLIRTAWIDGHPKAAMLSHRNLIANAIQLQCVWGLTAKDVHLCCLPLFHITAISLTLATQLAGGSTVVMPKFDAKQASTLIDLHKVTLLAEFAPMLEGLLSASADPPAQLASIRHVCGLDSPETIRSLQAICPDSTFWVGYGQTEVCGLVSLAPFRDAPGDVGFALPLCAIDIVGAEGQPVPPGEVGEIVVRGPSVFLGYWRRPNDNEQVFRGGWLHTGDSGRFDTEGRLWYSGRLPIKELIKTGGENVYPAEVEAVLRQHPALIDAAVIGVADAQWGEAVKAVCTPAAGMAPSESDVIDFVATRIARYKRPRLVVFVPALPKKSDGTNDRERIRQLYG